MVPTTIFKIFSKKKSKIISIKLAQQILRLSSKLLFFQHTIFDNILRPISTTIFDIIFNILDNFFLLLITSLLNSTFSSLLLPFSFFWCILFYNILIFLKFTWVISFKGCKCLNSKISCSPVIIINNKSCISLVC